MQRPRGREGEPAGPPASLVPPPARAREADLWQRFDRERAATRSRGDRVAAVVLLLVVMTARMRVGEHDNAVDEVRSFAVLAGCGAVILASGPLVEAGWFRTRCILVCVLKLAVATAPLFLVNALTFLEEKPGDEASGAAVAGGLLRIFVANHTALLCFMGVGMPVGIAPAAATQLSFLYFLARQTPELCNTPYMTSFRLASHKGVLMRILGNQATCATFVTAGQAAFGVLLPLFLIVRHEAAAAVKFARVHGMPQSSRRLRAYTWLHRATAYFSG